MKLQFYRSTSSPEDTSQKILKLGTNPIDLNNQGMAGMIAAQAHAASLGSGIKFSKKGKGFIKIKTKTSSSYVGLHASSKSQQLLQKPSVQRGNYMSGDFIETVAPDTKHPNNTSGLATGNHQNMQLLQKQKIKNSKTGKLIILKQSKTGSLKHSSSAGLNNFIPSVSSQKYIHPFHHSSQQQIYSTLDPSHKNSQIGGDTSLINLQIQGSPPALNNQSKMIPTDLYQNIVPSVTINQKKMVSFEKQQLTMEQLEQNRRQNSQRQVVIKKGAQGKVGKKNRRQRDNGPLVGRTGSLFSYSMSQSNLSAPTAALGGFQKLQKGKSTVIIGTKQQNVGRGLVLTKPFAKTKTSGFFKQAQMHHNNSNEKLNFNKTTGAMGFSSQMQHRSLTQSPARAIIAPMKPVGGQLNKQNLKFKPPLHNKRQNHQVISNDNQAQIQASVEDFIKMADEGINQINKELKKPQLENLQQTPIRPQQTNISRQNQQNQLQQQNNSTAKPQIRSNLNLSFNNSFNTSYGNTRPLAQDLGPTIQISQGNQGQESPVTHAPIIQGQGSRVDGSNSTPINIRNTPLQPENSVLTKVGEQNSSMNFQLSVRNQDALENQSSIKDVSGVITKDAILLEQNLTNRLQSLGDSSDPLFVKEQQKQKFQAFGQTFQEVIEQDKPFGALLLKIKQAYDDYLQQLTENDKASGEVVQLKSVQPPGPISQASAEQEPNQLQKVVDQQQLDIKQILSKQKEDIQTIKNQEIQNKNSHSEQIFQINQQFQDQITKFNDTQKSLEQQCQHLQQQLDKSKALNTSQQQEIKNLTVVLSQKEQENAAFQYKIEQLQNISVAHVQTQTDEMYGQEDTLTLKKVDSKLNKDKSVINMSLSISSRHTSAPRVEQKVLEKSNSVPVQNSQEINTGIEVQNERQELLDEIENLKNEAQKQSDNCVGMEDHINYLKLREKKIMYLVHLLQNQGYPVARIYDAELKQVHTERIQEFLDQKEQEALEMELGGPELDEKYHFSFHTDDSFNAIDDGPQLAPVRPECVPMLDLNDLPAYETSSEEGDEDQYQDDFEQEDGEYNEQSRGTIQNSAQYSAKQMPEQQYQQSMNYISDYYNRQQSHTTSNGEGNCLQSKTDEEEEDFRNLPPSSINNIQNENHVNPKDSQGQEWGQF